MAKVENLGPEFPPFRKLTFPLERHLPLAPLQSIAEDASDEESEPQKSVLLCGGDKLSRAGLQALIVQRRGLHVVAEVDHVLDLMTVAVRLQPSVIVVDLVSVAADDPRLVRARRQNATCQRVLAIAPSRGQEWKQRAMLIGAVGIVTRQESASIFLDSIERVADPRPAAVSPRATAMNEPSMFRSTLSAREVDVARLVCQGLRNEQIGRRLFISEATVRHHLTAIFAKRNVASRAELIVDAHRSAFLG